MMDVSVIIPVFNAERYLRETLESVLAQTHEAVEIIIVDNNSTDGSKQVARSFGTKLKLLDEPNAGATKARVTGFAAASGDAFMFLDADDLLGPTALEQLVAVLLDCPAAIAACPWYRYEEIEGEWTVRPPSCAPRKWRQEALSAWLEGWYHPPCSVLWSANAYERSGGWDPECKSNQDGDVIMRALVAGVPLIRTSGGAAYYRRLPGEQVSLSARRFEPDALAARIAVIERIERLLVEQDRISSYRISLRKAFGRLAQDAGGHDDLHRRAMDGIRRNRPGPLHWMQDRALRAVDRFTLLHDKPERAGTSPPPAR